MDDSDRLSVLHERLMQQLGRERYQLWVGSHTVIDYQAGACQISNHELTGCRTQTDEEISLANSPMGGHPAPHSVSVTGKLRIGCTSDFEKVWLRSRLHKTLLACCEAVWPGRVLVEYYVQAAQRVAQADHAAQADSAAADRAAPETTPPAAQPPHSPSAAQAAATSPLLAAPIIDRDRPVRQRPHLRTAGASPAARQPARRGPNSSFANFVQGKNNELAFRTAQSVANALGQYGPLLLYGPSGVGKTHLAYAMVRHWKEAAFQVRALRLTAEQFTTEFLTALDRRALPGFRHKYRTVDAFLVDDIQFLAGKRATLDELVYTIDTLQERGRQVVLTCDRSPGDLQEVSPELVSRISGGLSIPVELPDYNTRLGITRRFATQMGLLLEEDVVQLVASQVAGSARQLSGAINLLLATSMAHQTAITTEMARTTLVEYLQQNSPQVRLADIQRAVCQVFGVEPASLKSQRKTRAVAEPRMLAMWLARKYTRSALGEIGEYFGRRSHSTVISAQKKIERLVSNDAQIQVADRPCRVEEAIRQVESVLRTA